jgi:hypothetical protein
VSEVSLPCRCGTPGALVDMQHTIRVDFAFEAREEGGAGSLGRFPRVMGRVKSECPDPST